MSKCRCSYPAQREVDGEESVATMKMKQRKVRRIDRSAANELRCKLKERTSAMQQRRHVL
jgi:hypothetical protein